MNNEEPNRIILDRDEFIQKFGIITSGKTFINVEQIYCLACGAKQSININHIEQEISLLEYHYDNCELNAKLGKLT